MIRRMLNAMVTLGVIGVVVVFAARVAEPSVRPVLYPVSASPATLVAAVASQTSSSDAEPASGTTTVPIAPTVSPTTAVPAPATAVPPTTTVAPVTRWRC